MYQRYHLWHHSGRFFQGCVLEVTSPTFWVICEFWSKFSIKWDKTKKKLRLNYWWKTLYIECFNNDNLFVFSQNSWMTSTNSTGVFSHCSSGMCWNTWRPGSTLISVTGASQTAASWCAFTLVVPKRQLLAHGLTSSIHFSGFLHRKNAVVSEVKRYLTQVEQKPLPSYHLAYKKHTLSLEDLSTLADQNWLNDQVQMGTCKWEPSLVLADGNHPCFLLLLQVMNMYGELIMESAGHKVSLIIYLFFVMLLRSFLTSGKSS